MTDGKTILCSLLIIGLCALVAIICAKIICSPVFVDLSWYQKATDTLVSFDEFLTLFSASEPDMWFLDEGKIILYKDVPIRFSDGTVMNERRELAHLYLKTKKDLRKYLKWLKKEKAREKEEISDRNKLKILTYLREEIEKREEENQKNIRNAIKENQEILERMSK